MGTKVFAKVGKYQLHSDDRDVAVSWELRPNVWDWMQATGIEGEYQGACPVFDVDLWRIKNEQHRALFLLKWGNENRS